MDKGKEDLFSKMKCPNTLAAPFTDNATAASTGNVQNVSLSCDGLCDGHSAVMVSRKGGKLTNTEQFRDKHTNFLSTSLYLLRSDLA